MASDNGNVSPTASPTKAEVDVKSQFNERELNLLSIAMAHCLKSGPPEIDYQKFMTHGGFNTLKTAQNTWGKIKGKLGQATAGSGTTTPQKSQAQKGTPGSKKRGAKINKDGDNIVVAGADPDEGDDGSPAKKRKTAAKKGADNNIKQEESEGDADE